MGLGKYRTPFGKWLERNGLTSVEFAKECGVNRDTIGSMAGDRDYAPRRTTIEKVLKAARKRDERVKYEDLFPPM
ncbi:transcriptional regulator [Brevibacillus agri]|uniref:transcriptional regulator n=1 Tax=Brevibacillus agri TaxID=51101 RepID=UPI003D196EF6